MRNSYPPSCGRHHFFPKWFFQSCIVEHRVRQEPLQLGVLIFKRLQQLGFGGVYAAKFGLPFIDAGIADAMLAAKLRERHACFMLIQYPDDLLVCYTVAPHSLVLSMGQSLLQNGFGQRGMVTTNVRLAVPLSSLVFRASHVVSGTKRQAWQAASRISRSSWSFSGECSAQIGSFEHSSRCFTAFPVFRQRDAPHRSILQPQVEAINKILDDLRNQHDETEANLAKNTGKTKGPPPKTFVTNPAIYKAVIGALTTVVRTGAS